MELIGINVEIEGEFIYHAISHENIFSSSAALTVGSYMSFKCDLPQRSPHKIRQNSPKFFFVEKQSDELVILKQNSLSHSNLLKPFLN